MSRETAMEYLTDEKHGTFCSSEDKWIRKIRKWKEEYPEQVTITHEPVDPEDCLIAHLPKGWFAVRPPKKMKLTEEQKRQASERMKAMNANNRL